MTINYWAILVSALASMIIGWVWYGPLFGKMFMTAMGWDNRTPAQMEMMKQGMMKKYIAQFVASLLMFYVLAGFVGGFGTASFASGMIIAFFAWLGFVVPLKFGDALLGGSMTLFWLAIGNSLFALLVGGAILGVWR